MNNTTRNSLVSVLLALATVNGEEVKALVTPTSQPPSIESRLTRLSAVIRDKEAQLSEEPLSEEQQIAIGWANGGGGRGWANARRGGWADGYRGGWGNVNRWVNGWRDGGGFYNYNPWRNGGSFWNSY